MANVMIRRDAAGGLTFYLAKKDLEARIISVEYDEPGRWGGELRLDDGQAYFVEPMQPPRLPVSLRARRVGGES
jgi:nitrogen fixation protein NifT